ncbi:MAG: CHASE domain-containing protein [Victivallales bacterium]
MSNRSKYLMRLFLVVAGMLAITGTVYATLRIVIFTSFEKIERQQALDAMEKCEIAFNNEMSRISAMCHDWGIWDDAYMFVLGKNPTFVESNISNAILEGNQLNMNCIVGSDGGICHAQLYDLETKTNFKFSDLSDGKVGGDFSKMLRLPTDKSSLREIIHTEKGPFAAVSYPILTTRGEGPAKGVMLMGRFVDQRLIGEISGKTGLAVEMVPAGSGSATAAKHIELPGTGKYRMSELSPSFLKVEWTAKDINGKPAFTLSIKFRRDITRDGMAAIWLAMIVLVGLGTVFTVIVRMPQIKFIFQDQPESRTGWSSGHKLLVAMIVLLGFTVSMIMFHVFKKNEGNIQFKDFERNEAGPVAVSIQQRLDSLESDVDSIARFYNADEDVSREEFLTFTGHMLDAARYIRAFDWVPRVLRNERIEYEKKASSELNMEFHITEKSPEGKMVGTGERDEYFPVYYFEPRNQNQASAGFDNYSESSRKEVLDKARSTGERELAVNLSLVQDKVKKAGFLYFQPVYGKNKPVGNAEERTANIKGFIAAVFHMDDVVDSILSDVNRRNMLLNISELDEDGKDRRLIYSNGAAPSDIDAQNEFVRKFYFGGRRLAVSCQPTPEFIASQMGRTPFYVMAIGMLLTVIMSMVVYLHIQRTIKESEKQYRLLFDEMMSGFALHEIICDAKGAPVDYRFIAVNEAFENLTGLKAADLIGRRVLEVLPSTEKTWIERYGKVALEGEPAQFEEFSAELGKYYDVRAFCPEKGKFAVIFQDVSERRGKEEMLLNASREWRTTFDAVSDAVWLLDREQRIVRCNKATLEFTGKDFKDILGKPCCEVIHGTVRPLPGCPVMRMKSTKQKESQELKIGNKWFLVKADPIFDEKGEISGAVHIVSDITGRKLSEEEKFKLEEQLHQAQKIESIGRLAGGVAHDFNNLLTPIIGYAEVLKMDLPAGDPRRDQVNEIKSAAERAKDLTRQLLAFGRKQMLELKIVDLGKVIVNFEKMLRRTIREDIRIELSIPDNVGKVRADVGQVEQVILNLAVNAQDAMPRGGVFNMSLENVHLEEEDLDESEAVKPGDFVCLSVRDTGHGMDKTILDHIFEPFFTTKQMGHGTGLGLSMIYGIVRQHEGHVRVFSEIGAGTTFRIYLPVAGEEHAEAPAVLSGKSNKGNETVLIVEDNEMVRNIASLLLNSSGYRAIVFESPEECIRFVEKGTDHIDMLLTDVIMPSINGKELYDRIHTKRPQMKVLFMSGYDRNVVAQHGVLEKGVHFLQKPFSVESLSEKVRETLDS